MPNWKSFRLTRLATKFGSFAYQAGNGFCRVYFMHHGARSAPYSEVYRIQLVIPRSFAAGGGAG